MSDWEFFPEVDDRMDAEFMARLIQLRREVGFPLMVTSSFRTPEVNTAVGGAPDSAHLHGRAVDIAISFKHAYDLFELAMEYGFSGIGLKQHGPAAKRFIHIDDMPVGDTRPRIWTYSGD